MVHMGPLEGAAARRAKLSEAPSRISQRPALALLIAKDRIASCVGLPHYSATRPARDLSGWLRSMIATIRHRGPTARGWSAATGRGVQAEDQPADWGLGHVRLAILDLSPAGLQPMSTPDRQTWISYNGEVYNYLELATELRQAGHRVPHRHGYGGDPGGVSPVGCRVRRAISRHVRLCDSST